MAAAPIRVEGLADRPRFYLPELDSLRFLAFLAVFSAHTILLADIDHSRPLFRVPAEMGSFGVDLFFALSAYLLTELLMREKDRYGSISAGAFYIRLSLRIWPLYFVFLASVYLTKRWIDLGVTNVYLAFFLIFAGNFAIYIRRTGLSLVIGPLWSLSVEEQVYAIWPWVAKAMDRRALVWFSAGIWAVSVLYRVYLFDPSDPERIWYFTLCRLDPIACVILLSAGYFTPRLPRSAIVAAGLSLWIFAGWLDPHSREAGLICMVVGYPAIALGAGAFLLATIGANNRWILHRWPIKLGRISYGLYVFHTTALLTFDGIYGWPLLALTATIGTGLLSYHFLETPFLTLKKRFEL